MKKLLSGMLCVGLVVSSLFSVETAGKMKLSKSPIDTNFLSVENGGSLSAIDSYSDGIGMKVVGVPEGKVIDNSKMNLAVFEYGVQAKTAESPLKAYLNDTVGSGTGENIEIIGSAGGVSSVIGEPCDDGKANTVNDIYVDNQGTCKGVVVKNENKCYGDQIGSTFIYNGNEYTVVDNNSIREVVSGFVEFAEFLCVSNVTDMGNLFSDQKNIPDISEWDVSNVTSMAYLFGNQKNIPDISEWDVSNVRDMSGMFIMSTVNVDISNWDVSNVTNMDLMFFQATFNGDISNWNVSRVLSMRDMFSSSSFNGNISNWDVSNVVEMGGMFSMSSFNRNISGWNVSNVMLMNGMFALSSFDGDISKWDVSSVIDMNSMFYGATFNGDISNWNVSNVVYMNSVFSYSSFNKNISSWNISNVINTGNMFYNASSFNQNMSSWSSSKITQGDFEGTPIFNNPSFLPQQP